MFALVALAAPRAALPAPVAVPRPRPGAALPGDARCSWAPRARSCRHAPPAWLAAGAPALVLTGAVLADVGLPAPLLTPEQAALFTLDAV